MKVLIVIVLIFLSVNRNPPQVLAPAGIVQSTQPHAVVEPFTNSKESSVLIELREESKKRFRNN